MKRPDFVDVLQGTVSRTLTERQRVFVRCYVASGGNASESARSAGYSEESCRATGYKLTRNPAVMRAVREEQMAVIGGRAASKAILTLEKALDDPEVPWGAKIDAARTILDRAGIVSVPAHLIARSLEEKDVSEMTAEELRVFIREGTAQLAEIERERAEEDEREERPALPAPSTDLD